MHRLLQRQIDRCFDGPPPAELADFLERVDAAYEASDVDRKMLERVMEISSRELHQANAELRAVLSAFPDLFLWVNGAGRIVETQNGDPDDPLLSGDGLVGRSLDALPDQAFGKRLQGLHERVVASGAADGVEYEVLREGSTQVYESRAFPIEADLTFIITRNVSDTRRAELAEAANRSKSDFLANMSHELRTPLHGILSFARFGLKKTGEPESAGLNKYFTIIQESGETLLSLLDELLDIAKLDAGMMRYEFERVDLKEVLEKELDHFRSRVLESDLTIDAEFPDEAVELPADPHRLAQVIRNLLSNAVKFSPAGGVIRVRSESDAGRVRVQVADEGPGIPEGEVEQVFEKFVQSSSTSTGAGGTGLGLSICKQIVEAHGGTVWAENGPVGSRFTVELPIDTDSKCGTVHRAMEATR